mmetsp:Transcript_19985/g.36428  ORF Transcript_19985/g.36428 Transcript_19985/m.36428 type:complete len:179 (+) Transcript_19985:232-768(+)
MACQNLFLRAYAFSGDINKAQDILRRMGTDGMEPNVASWRQALKAAMKATKSDIVGAFWDVGVAYGKKKDSRPFAPTVSNVELPLNVYLHGLRNISKQKVRNLLNKNIMSLYEGIESKSEERGLHHESLSVKNDVEDNHNQQSMLAILRTVVSYKLSLSLSLSLSLVDITQPALPYVC